jgi:hypothetical protein
MPVVRRHLSTIAAIPSLPVFLEKINSASDQALGALQAWLSTG